MAGMYNGGILTIGDAPALKVDVENLWADKTVMQE